MQWIGLDIIFTFYSSFYPSTEMEKSAHFTQAIIYILGFLQRKKFKLFL